MNRRRLLGTAGTAALSLAAGCTGVFGGGNSYPTETFEGQTVPLVPVADAYEWWDADDARFVDTRGQNQYDASHVPGAVLSSPFDDDEPDPTADWDRDGRIVTYCNCPHSLAVNRASGLLSDGFPEVYALDEGYHAWVDAGHPIESNDPDASTETYTITGHVGAERAGEYGHVSTAEGENYESIRVDADGSYETTIRFPDLTAESVLIVEVSGDTHTAPLSELVSDSD